MAPTRARNTWDEEQRTVLHLLVQRDDLSWDEKTRIFNHIFNDHLHRHGYANGLPRTTLNIQYCESRREVRAKIWQPILSPTGDKISYQVTLRGKIQQTQHCLEGLAPVCTTGRSQPHHISSLSVNVDRHGHPVHKTPAAVRIPVCKTQRTSHPGIVKGQPIQLKVSPRGHKVRRGEEASIPYIRRKGATLTLTPTEFATTQAELIPVPWATAHPPLTGLLFRYWHDRSSGLNSAMDGFIAGRYMYSNIMPPPPPKCDNFNQWSDVYLHLNGDKVASPYVSVSNSLPWVFRQALGHYKKGQSGVHITVIDASILDRETVFHAKPYHKEMRKKHAFTEGAHRYHATYELLVWHEIPKKAIRGTFTIQDILELEGKSPDIAAALRLQELSELGCGYRTTILPRWLAEAVGLDDAIIQTMAELCNFVKLDVSSIDHVSYVVSQYIIGWGIVKSPSTAEQWLKQATQFAEALAQARSISASLPVLTSLMTAYLFGVQLSCGDSNALFQASSARLMRKRAKAIGLEDPAGMVAQYFHDSLARVFSYDHFHRLLLDLPPSNIQFRDRLQEYRADVDFCGRPHLQGRQTRAMETPIRVQMPRRRAVSEGEHNDAEDEDEIRYEPVYHPAEVEDHDGSD